MLKPLCVPIPIYKRFYIHILFTQQCSNHGMVQHFYSIEIFPFYRIILYDFRLGIFVVNENGTLYPKGGITSMKIFFEYYKVEKFRSPIFMQKMNDKSLTPTFSDMLFPLLPLLQVMTQFVIHIIHLTEYPLVCVCACFLLCIYRLNTINFLYSLNTTIVLSYTYIHLKNKKLIPDNSP